MTEWTELRARCELRVDDLLRATGGIPVPWDMDEFLDRLERHRGRDIDIVAVSWSMGDSTGAWQRREDCDVIAYPSNTAPLHADAVILHELGHMISEHRGRCVLSVQEAQERAPDLGAAAFAHLLDRVSVDDEEREAETIATMLLSRIVAQDSPRTRPLVDRPDLAARVEQIFG